MRGFRHCLLRVGRGALFHGPGFLALLLAARLEGCRRRGLHPKIEPGSVFEILARAGERGFAEGYGLAVLLEGGFGETQEPGAGERPQNFFELAAGELAGGEQFAIELAGGAHAVLTQGAEDAEGEFVLPGCGLAKALRNAGRGRTETANTASFLTVRQVTEVPDQGGHAALIAFGVPQHEVELALLLIDLDKIGIAPAVVAAADVFGVVDLRATMDPEFFQGFVERLLVHADAAPEVVFRHGLDAQAVKDRLEYRGIGVVALKKEIMGAAVGVGVHEDGAAG